MNSEDPIQGILGFQPYAAALQDHLTSLRSSISFSIFELKGGLIQDNGHAHLNAIRTDFCKAISRNSSSSDLHDQKHLNVRECIHGRGVGLCNISFIRMDMEKMSCLGYATPM